MDMERSLVTVATPDELTDLVTRAVREGLKELNRHAPHTSPEKKLLTAKDVELEYGIPERTLEYWRRVGIGPAYINVRRRIFYERVVLEDHLVSGRIRTEEWGGK
jgi:hypothetical protein